MDTKQNEINKRSLPEDSESSSVKKFKAENDQQIKDQIELSEEKDLPLILKGKPKKNGHDDFILRQRLLWNAKKSWSKNYRRRYLNGIV